MSKTHCRNCSGTFEGIYAICPRCGFDMLGNATGAPTPSATTESESPIEKSLRDMYELGKKHGYQEAIDDLQLHAMVNFAPHIEKEEK